MFETAFWLFGVYICFCLIICGVALMLHFWKVTLSVIGSVIFLIFIGTCFTPKQICSFVEQGPLILVWGVGFLVLIGCVLTYFTPEQICRFFERARSIFMCGVGFLLLIGLLLTIWDKITTG
jgi:hypothetical protein